MKKDIVIAGVGGQGNLFASNVLCQCAIKRGLNVLGTETIGAAQRGGSVVSHIRISDGPVYSPLIPSGSADILLGMESLELLRNMKMLGREGYYILNLYSVPTVYTNLGIDRYPSQEEILQALRKTGKKGYEIQATYKAAELGTPQMTNVVMLGALVKVDDFFKYDEVKKLAGELSPKRFFEKNLMGFEVGYQLIEGFDCEPGA
jgi:indolepyruvate ferredoxin oxidoreductase beta subunit